MEPTRQPLAPDFGPPPDSTTWPAYQASAVQVTPRPRRSRLKAAIGGFALAGLLIVGGAATVFAADPSPSPSTAPSVTNPSTSPGTNGGTQRTPGTKADCPHDQTTTDTTTDSTTGSSS